jgi:hypothetical protein
MNPITRPWFVYGIGAGVLLFAIFFFAVVTGWPASPDQCVYGGNCYCESFNLHAVETGARGLRQPVNTLSNLYALVTALIVAWRLSKDRAEGASGNVMKSTSLMADAYVFAVLFLGLGSMWFHASLSKTVEWMDGFSMYVYAGYLVWYTVDRVLVKKQCADLTRTLVFWICWPATAIVFTLIGTAVSSLYLIIILVVAYIVLELLVGWLGSLDRDDWLARLYWFLGLLAMGIATVFWALSATGGPICHPDSAFQAHGMIWHPFAGIMAVLLYFYWRRENAPH